MFKPKCIKELPKNKLFCYRKYKSGLVHDLWGKKIADNLVAVHILAKVDDDKILQIRIDPEKQLREIKISPEQQVWA